MAEEFVDLYEVLELPVDADRNTLRKRVNEMYLDAQRNLDHRNFATRVKFQELFEVTLPQARYILLDDGRRDDYDRLVHAFRGAKNGGPPAPRAPRVESAPITTIPESTSGFSLERHETSVAGEISATVEPLPPAEIDPAQLQQEREELWKKWKSGLEAALHTEADKPKSRGAATSAPTSFSMATPMPEVTPAVPVVSVPASPVAPAAAVSKPAARPKINVSFDFTEKEEESEVAPFQDDGHGVISEAELEQRRVEHRRHLVKEVLVNVGLIWGVIGALLIVLPCLIGLITASGHYFPRGEKPLVSWPSQWMWAGGLLLMTVAAFFTSRELSKTMRRKKATELASLSYEALLKQIGKS